MPQDWNESLVWIQKAASNGNSTALLFLNNVCSEGSLVTEEPKVEQSKRNTALLELARRCVQDGWRNENSWNLIEHYRFLESREYTISTEDATRDLPLAFGFSQKSGFTLENDDWRNGDEFDRFLADLWFNLQRNPQDSILSGLDFVLCKKKDANGFTLLHRIARCYHPRFKKSCFDIIKRMGEILIEKGCPVDEPPLVDPPGVFTNDTPLMAAVLARNFSILEVLIGHGVDLNNVQNVMILIIQRHDYELLERVLPALRKIHQEGDWMMSLICQVLNIPIQERRLRHGPRYLIRGQRTLELLLQHRYGEGYIPIFDASRFLESATVSGNHDLFEDITKRILNFSDFIQKPGRPLQLLHLSIQKRYRDVFLMLLRYGIDINQPFGPPGDTPIFFAAKYLDLDSFFFEQLMSRDADLSVINGDGHTVLNELIYQEKVEEALKSVLSKAPELLDCDLDGPILSAAVVGGTLTAVSTLLQCGAVSTVIDDSNSDALIWATFNESPTHLEKLKILLSHEKMKSLNKPETDVRLHVALGNACIRGNESADGTFVGVRSRSQLLLTSNVLRNGSHSVQFGLSPAQSTSSKATARC